MTTRGRTVSSTHKLPTRALDETRVLAHKPAEMRRAVPSTGTTRKGAPTEIVEPNAPVPTVVRKRRGEPRNVDKKVPAYEPKEVLVPSASRHAH